MQGYLKNDGRKGIRNIVTVVYLVECARHVSTHIGNASDSSDVHVIGFPGSFPNEYAQTMMERLCTHPNVGAVLLVSLGCENFDRFSLSKVVGASGRPVHTVRIQQDGGTRVGIEGGIEWVKSALVDLKKETPVRMDASYLVIGTICGGSDGTSGLTANPLVGSAFYLLVKENTACIFEETGELIGCEEIMACWAATPELADELLNAVQKATHYYSTMGYSSFAPGNADGGLSSIEEKSLEASAKSGASTISSFIKPGDIPTKGGLYLLDVVPDGEVRFGFPNINDNAEIAELIACGSHIILFTTGRGSVVGSAISPVIKFFAKPETYERMQDDMDIDSECVLDGKDSLDQVGQEIRDLITKVCNGAQSKSEELGHTEFILTYKSFEPIGPCCLSA